MGIFRDDSHKIKMSWIQVQVNGSTGPGPGPSGPVGFSDGQGWAGGHGGHTLMFGHFQVPGEEELACGCVPRGVRLGQR